MKLHHGPHRGGTGVLVADWWSPLRRSVSMHLHTYKDDQKSRHFDLVRDGENPGSFDLVLVSIWALLAAGAVCALVAPFQSMVTTLSRWVH
jgi:hypothetical protein